MFNLKDKVAIVTGGGSGIGKAIAKRFAAQGARVAILDCDADRAGETTNEIGKLGGAAELSVCGVDKWEEVERSIGEIHSRHGRIDILVNNAGISSIGDVSETTGEEMDRVYAINIKGVYHGLRACVDRMAGQGGGVILNIGSIASLVGIERRFAYSMSKGAVLTMTLSVARDYIGKHIRCNCICPARIHTPFVDSFLEKNYSGQQEEMFAKLSKSQPMGRMGKPEEVADLALFLCSDEAAFITGSVYTIDGGFTHLL